MYKRWLNSVVYVFLFSLVDGQLINDTVCYGDSSSGSNLVQAACSSGVIHVNAILAGSKPLSLGCPAIDHAYSETEQILCCQYDTDDCLGQYDGDITNYLTCNGERLCVRPVIRTRTHASCPAENYRDFTNYMMFQYRCVPDHNLHGACNTTEQCLDEHAICDKNVCICGPGSTENNDRCFLDGTPGGVCNHVISCNGSDIDCINNVCQCHSGFSAVNYICLEDGSLNGLCSDTIPCSDEKAVCSGGICECVTGYEEMNSECIKSNIELINSSYCYGDSSNGQNLVDVACDEGVIRLYDIIAGSKPIQLGCPADDHQYTPAEQATCCTYNDADCLTPYTGDWTTYLSCNGRAICSGLPIIRIETDPLCNTTMAGSYKRYSNYMIFQYYCVPDYRLHGACNTTEQCTDDHTVCNTSASVCLCRDDAFETSDTCIPDGEIGGRCSNTIVCKDTNAECSSDDRCRCKAGYSANGYTCIQDGHVGGFCNASIPCVSTGSVCSTDNICVCQSTGYTQRVFVCIPDGSVGGRCIDGQCNDTATVCSSNDVCECMDNYTEVDRTCRKDGGALGKCHPDGGCDDVNSVCNAISALECGVTECDPGVCTCVSGYSVTTVDTCMEDGTLGGRCSGVIQCTDNNTVCSSDLVCVCDTGYTEYNGQCVQDGTPGGNCIGGVTCTSSNTVCSNSGVCECATGYTEVNRTCKNDGDVGGKCNPDGTCNDALTVCTASAYTLCGASSCDPGVCVCIHGYSSLTSDTCIKDGEVGGRCSNVVCEDSNAECSTDGICICKAGYSANGNRCIADGHVGGHCNSTISCVDGGSYCTSDNVCGCLSGYTRRNFVCIPDGDVGGNCIDGVGGQCTQANTVCNTNGVCECVSGHSEVNSLCVEDGANNGKCQPSGGCDDTRATCNVSSGLECGVTVCDPGVCTCVTGYSPHVDDGTCVEDGSVGGRCSLTMSCRDTHSMCVDNTCVCNSGYTEHNRECVEDGSVGGGCTMDTDCVDPHARCSADNVCACVDGYTQINRQCKQDGVVGGICDPNRTCTGNHVVCIDDNGSQCGGAACNPGICACTTGYREVTSGTCTKDGDIDGRCETDDDCDDVSAVCDPLTSVCACPSGFTEIEGVCKQDGMPDGVCLTSAVTPCIDSHSVCTVGMCRCNVVRNYVNVGGTCKKDDDYVLGKCRSNGDCLTQSSSSYCNIDGVCECVTGYSAVNGQCVKDKPPTVTACDGDDPYNALQPECPPGLSALVLRELPVVKPASANCPAQLDTYSQATYESCCTPGTEDCIVYTDISTDCDPAITYMPNTNFRMIEYVCSTGDDTIEIDDNDIVTGRPMFLTSPGYPGDNSQGQSERRCSVQASCDTKIDVIILIQDNSNCGRSLVIVEGQTNIPISCNHRFGLSPVYTTLSSHVIIQLTSTAMTSPMKFVVKFEPQASTANVTVSCGSQIVTTPATVGACAPEPGSLGGRCSATLACNVTHSICVNGVCTCSTGYSQSESSCTLTGELREGKSESESSSSSSLIIIIGAVVGVLALIGIAAVAAFLYRERLRKRFCPREEPDLDKVVPIPHGYSGPSPMNTKFPRRDPLDTEKRRTLPPIDGGHAPETDMTPNGAVPLVVRPGEDNVVRTRFTRSARRVSTTGNVNGFVHSVTETPASEGGEKQSKKERKKDKKRKKKLGKMKKSFRNASVGISAMKAFELPQQGTEGLYRRRPDLESGLSGHPPPGPPPGTGFFSPHMPLQGNVGAQTFSSASPSHPPPNPLSRLPPLSSTIGSAGSSARARWQTAGTAAMMTGQANLMRRTSRLDITSVDDPCTIETTEQEL